MNFLFSNYPPVKTGGSNFAETFYDLFSKSVSTNIAVGYITADSLAELKNTCQMSTRRKLNLTIGMHYFDRFTKLEYQAAMDLHVFLKENGAGAVRLVTPFRFHGKLYSFSATTGVFAGIIGSNNLSSIIETCRTYEASVLLRDQIMVRKLDDFILQLNKDATKPIDEINILEFNDPNNVLENHEGVQKISPLELAECLSNLTTVSFDIPIKASSQHAKSNLNAFFGKGREGKNGLVKSRHWYEAEIIVGKEMTSKPYYPQAETDNSIFDVITDDAWRFKCKISGDYSKNFRSEGDLKILGKWIKGRLEAAGSLVIGEPVTENVLKKYGRSNFTFRKTSTPNLWYLDFGVK
jgi:hypothetical protein